MRLTHLSPNHKSRLWLGLSNCYTFQWLAVSAASAAAALGTATLYWEWMLYVRTERKKVMHYIMAGGIGQECGSFPGIALAVMHASHAMGDTCIYMTSDCKQ